MQQNTIDLRGEGPAHYTRPAVVLHWLIAVALLGQIVFGWLLESIPRGIPARGLYVNLHKSTGLTLALLILLRVLWRLLNRPPQLPSFMPKWERQAARWSHAALYICMIGMPLSGYIASNFSKYGVKLFNAVTLPPWGANDPLVYAIFNTTHVVLSYLFVAMIVVHVLAAVRHAVKRDGVLARMWFG